MNVWKNFLKPLLSGLIIFRTKIKENPLKLNYPASTLGGSFKRGEKLTMANNYEFRKRIRVGSLDSNQQYKDISVVYTNSWDTKGVRIPEAVTSANDIMEELGQLVDYRERNRGINKGKLMIINLKFELASVFNGPQFGGNYTMVYAYGDLVKLTD